MKNVVGRKVSFRDSEIEIIFQEIFKHFNFSETSCQKMTQILWDEHHQAKVSNEKRRAHIQRRLEDLVSYKNQAYEDKLMGAISEEMWLENSRRWDSESSVLELSWWK